MPVQSQEQETLNVKLVHFTKQNSPDEPVQVAFSVVDDQGKEEIITGEIPYSYDLFRLFQVNGWLNIRRGVYTIREVRSQRRAMSAYSQSQPNSRWNPEVDGFQRKSSENHSLRKVTLRSVLRARIAGRYPPSNATQARTATAAAKTP